jgi:predicted DNA-binding protein with PD1-like motif
MADGVQIQAGRIGKVVYGRMAPNEDLVQGIEKLCIAQGLRHALVRCGLGSLVDACLDVPGGQRRSVAGPAVEVLSLFGEVRAQADGTLRADLSGLVVNAAGQVTSGLFVAGANPVFATFELTLEEWLPQAA